MTLRVSENCACAVASHRKRCFYAFTFADQCMRAWNPIGQSLNHEATLLCPSICALMREHCCRAMLFIAYLRLQCTVVGEESAGKSRCLDVNVSL